MPAVQNGRIPTPVTLAPQGGPPLRPGPAAASNRRYHQLIGAGTSGLSVAFDLPTQMGYDSGAAAARGRVGKFTVDEEEPYEPLRVDPGIADAQAQRLRELRARRDQVAAGKAADAVKSAAEGTGLRAAPRAGATPGEVRDALRAVRGTYQPPDAG
jgi:methylmalonyl-CoA mutase N-terminal domain/subunit